MNKQILRKLMVLMCAFSISSCCNFVKSMKADQNIVTNNQSNTTYVIEKLRWYKIYRVPTNSEYKNAEDIMDLLFGVYDPDETFGRLMKAYSAFRDVSLDEKRNFIFMVVSCCGKTLKLESELKKFSGIKLDSEEMGCCSFCNLYICKFLRTDVGSNVSTIKSHLYEDFSEGPAKGKMRVEVSDDINKAKIVIMPEVGDVNWTIEIS